MYRPELRGSRSADDIHRGTGGTSSKEGPSINFFERQKTYEEELAQKEGSEDGQGQSYELRSLEKKDEGDFRHPTHVGTGMTFVGDSDQAEKAPDGDKRLVYENAESSHHNLSRMEKGLAGLLDDHSRRMRELLDDHSRQMRELNQRDRGRYYDGPRYNAHVSTIGAIGTIFGVVSTAATVAFYLVSQNGK